MYVLLFMPVYDSARYTVMNACLGRITLYVVPVVRLAMLHGHLRPLRSVKFVNGLTPSNKWPVRQRVYSSYCILSHSWPACQRAFSIAIKRHVRALFVNGMGRRSNTFLSTTWRA